MIYLIAELIIVLFAISGCTTLEPVIVTDVEGEYIIRGRDTTPFISLQKDAEKNAIDGAIEFCNSLGKKYIKRYVITTPMAGGKFADATLYFRCVDKIQTIKGSAR